MKTWNEMMKKGPYGLDSYENYTGSVDHAHMLVFLAQTRDADSDECDNFRIALERLGGESEEVQVHRFGHWAFGWIEFIFVDPKAKDKVQIAEGIIIELVTSPVLD